MARQRNMHEQELPVAQLCAMTANQNRDPKKQKKAFALTDFTFFQPKEDQNLASMRYATAAVHLIKQGKLPTFALFCYKELAPAADENYVPGVLSFQCEDAILLHPEREGDEWTGMLIAQESCNKQVRTMVNEHGVEIRVRMPEISTKVVAEEGARLLLA